MHLDFNHANMPILFIIVLQNSQNFFHKLSIDQQLEKKI